MGHHARLSPSKGSMWTNCLGAIPYADKHIKEEESSVYAMEGTAAHSLIEICLRDGIDMRTFIGRHIEVLDSGGTTILKDVKDKKKLEAREEKESVFFIDVEMVDAASKAVDYVIHRCTELGLMKKKEKDPLSKVKELVEKEVILLEQRFHPGGEHRDDIYGTADIVINAWPSIIEIVDYKHGAGVTVDIEDNTQLRLYAAGALEAFGWEDYEVVRYSICQPRVYVQHAFYGVKYEEVEPAELKDWMNWVFERAELVDEAQLRVDEEASLKELYKEGFIDATPNEGHHCIFCPLKADCPSLFAQAQKAAALEFDDLPEEGEVLAVPEDNERLIAILPWVDTLLNYLRAVQKEATNQLAAGREIPGYKLVEGRSSGRTFPEKYNDAKIVKLLTKLGLDEDDIYKKSLITAPQAEKKLTGESKKALQELLERKPGNPVVAPASDRRPAVVVDAGSEFDDTPVE